MAAGPPDAGCSTHVRTAAGWQALPSLIVPLASGVFSFELDGTPIPVREAWAKGPNGWRRTWVRNLPPPALAAPTLAAAWNAGAGAADVTATWAASADADVTGYELEWSSPAVVVDTVTGVTKVRQFPAATTVQARVRALDWYGEPGPWSPAASIVTTIQLATPPAPSVVGSSWGEVTFSVPAVANAESYRLEVLNEAGASVKTVTGTNPALLWVNGLANDTRYQFRVRAERASGGGSIGAYGPVARYAMGHPSQQCQRYEERTRPWSSGPVAVSLKRDQMGGPNVPARVLTHTMTVHVACRNAAGGLTSSAMTSGTRQLNYVLASAAGFPTGAKPSPWDEALGWVQGSPGIAGLIPTGSGWSLSGSDYMVVGTIQVDGTETYDELVWYECVAQVPNAPW